MSTKIPLAQYLFRRLKQHGVDVMHGVPGDYTLQALDQLKPSGIKWVGNCNELNAGYAADGYARIAGLGAVLTTYGVGELSAINAIAGSMAERVPVIHIVGTPPVKLINDTFRLHHSLNDGRNRVFKIIHSKILYHAWLLDDASKACAKIDTAIGNSLQFSKPNYIALPSDLVMAPVSAIPLSDKLNFTDTNQSATHQVVEKLLTMFYQARRPLILVDRSSGMDALRVEINDFVRHSGIPTLTLPSGAGMIDHSLPNYFGVHAGPVGQIDTTDYVASADLVFCLGPMFSDTQTLGWKVLPKSDVTVELRAGTIHFRRDVENSHNIDTRLLLSALTHSLEPEKLADVDVRSLGNFRTIPQQPKTDDDARVNQTTLYHRLNRYLRPHDIILLANATPILGGRDFVLPDASCRVIASGMWFSVGHMLPAALGAALAQQRRSDRSSNHGRVVLFDGDGSFQATAQELSVIIRERLNVTIFIINNAGYAYERLIHGLNESYNDISPWDYLSLPTAFGAQPAIEAAKAAGEAYSVDTIRLDTNADVEAFLRDERFDNGHGGNAVRGLKLVDIRVRRADVPEKFRAVFQSAGQSLGAQVKLPESSLALAGGSRDVLFSQAWEDSLQQRSASDQNHEAGNGTKRPSRLRRRQSRALILGKSRSIRGTSSRKPSTNDEDDMEMAMSKPTGHNNVADDTRAGTIHDGKAYATGNVKTTSRRKSTSRRRVQQERSLERPAASAVRRTTFQEAGLPTRRPATIPTNSGSRSIFRGPSLP